MLIRSRAPLRLGLAGGGTDVTPFCDNYGGYVLNATIDMYAYCTLESRDDGMVIIDALDQGQCFTGAAEGQLALDGYLELHKAIYNKMISRYNNGNPLSFSMTTYSDAPTGSGLGGSSTMVVAIIKAFVEWLNLPLGEYDIAHLSYEIERIDVGIIGGKQDQYVATFGGFNFMEFYDNERVVVNPLRVKNWIINELESSLVLYFTGIRRQASIIEEEKQNAIKKIGKTLEAMQETKKDAVLMKEAILKGDIHSFAQIIGKSWEQKKQMADSVSNAEIDKVLTIALEHGAYSGKVSGAGGGGFMFFVVDPRKKFKLTQALNAINACGGARVMNFHFTKDGTTSWRI